MEAVLREARKMTTARGIPLLVVIEPSAVDLTTNQLFSYRDLHNYPGYRRNNLSSFVDAICGREGIARIDLFETWVNAKPEDLYFRFPNNHWNDRGQDRAAEATADYIWEKMRTHFVAVLSPSR